MIVILSGVSGVGKTTVGSLLAKDLGWRFYDADDFHSAANIKKMQAGIALDDDDRSDWLGSLRDMISGSISKNEDAVLACSALKESYRNHLCVDETVKVVLLQADPLLIKERLSGRQGHFMNPKLLRSQFETLEIPTHGIVINASKPPADLVAEIRRLVFMVSASSLLL